ncbi:hypothetical protein NHX12_013295 [Muraenolepis orangiensis]|uniref:Androgen-dependent TFPI-regulating protein n=1 Tax=Muraenolepis orangiensis TaxID=630683 RepID=A0A9Q0I6R9_9TELE|nr:hypothetical protein NHX12_013295 [Muraenolepis orangiensis]
MVWAGAPRGSGGLCLHVVMFSWYVFVLSYETRYLTMLGLDMDNVSYGGQWKYLTYVNLVLQAVFFGVCVLADVVVHFLPGGVESLLVDLRDDLFSMFAFPYSALVFSVFWTAHVAGQAQYTPLVEGEVVPPWLNQARHTGVLLLVLVQMCVQNHVFSSRLKRVPLTVLSGVLYMAWLLWVHHASGIWVYTFLAKLTPMSVLVLCGACLVLLLLLQLLGEKLSGTIWANNPGSQKKRN